ncbi:ground-like domain-containing protein [Ditylenchus destructor]|uniref:Ground-like domain-containing protein n=1 Tax=Ditylenchus destructor TaxID=166010 RepID=A0AAD4MPH3_9BILA|nr:ground-like domain-containing protein [Ditylenchus destructor]
MSKDSVCRWEAVADAGEQQVVKKLLKDESIPCPQAEWRSLMDAQITDRDATTSANAIQTAFQARYPGHPFLVMCSQNKSHEVKDQPTKLRLSASGDGYCVVSKDNIWCQAVALSA